MKVRLTGIAGLLHTWLAAAAMTTNQQTVLAPDNLADFTHPEGSLPRLADLLTLEGRASIFYSYARETEMSLLFTESVSEGEGTTVFVPTNKAVQALARKPHEGPEGNDVGGMNAEFDATSKHNVQRWVGAHIIPYPDVDFTSSTPYNTLTPGATIEFSRIKRENRFPAYETITGTDAAHFSSVKDKHDSPGSDSSCLLDSKNCDYPGAPDPRTGSSINHPPFLDTDAAHFASIKGPVSNDRDTTHFSNIQESSTLKPIWKQYELNHGVYIISKKKASNGVMYLIDGTVSVGAE